MKDNGSIDDLNFYVGDIKKGKDNMELVKCRKKQKVNQSLQFPNIKSCLNVERQDFMQKQKSQYLNPPYQQSYQSTRNERQGGISLGQPSIQQSYQTNEYRKEISKDYQQISNNLSKYQQSIEYKLKDADEQLNLKPKLKHNISKQEIEGNNGLVDEEQKNSVTKQPSINDLDEDFSSNQKQYKTNERKVKQKQKELVKFQTIEDELLYDDDDTQKNAQQLDLMKDITFDNRIFNSYRNNEQQNEIEIQRQDTGHSYQLCSQDGSRETNQQNLEYSDFQEKVQEMLKNLQLETIQNSNQEETYSLRSYDRNSSPLQGNMDKNVQDPKLNYFLKCNSEVVLALPALSKIRNKFLALQGYQLNNGICKALKKSLQLFEKTISKIVLDNNGLDDQMASEIFEGLQSQDDLKSLVINRNEIEKQSVNLILNMLQRPFPKNLEELRIINCKIHTSQSYSILQTINEKNCNIRKLSLVNASLTDICIPQLNSIILQSRALIDFDISWNRLRSQNMQNLLQSICKNRTLQYLNISWNNICNQQSENNKEEEIDVVEHLTRFIKSNKNLLHIDLSYTSLPENVLIDIGSSLKRAKSLLSIQFTGNSGVTTNAKTYLFDRIRCKKNNKQQLKNIKNHFQSIQESISNQSPILEGMTLKQVLDKKKIPEKIGSLSNPFEKKRNLVFQRWLGHKQDIPGSGQWQLLYKPEQDCWVCDKWIYTIIVWNKMIAFQDKNVVATYKQDFLTEEEQIVNKEIKEQVPYIHGSFTNDQQHKMLPIEDFCQMIDKEYISPLTKLQEKGKISDDIQDESQLKSHQKELLEKVKQEGKMNYRESWRKFLNRNIKYKKWQLINQQFLQKYDKDQDLYVYACFAKPGRNLYSVKFKENQNSNVELFQHKFISAVREEEIMVYVKQSKFKTIERVFKKDTSVFKDWKEDTKKTLKDTLQYDFSLWKVHRFIKDENDRQQCEEIFSQNVQELKKIFMTEVCISSFPNISWIDFSNFCEKCKIFDKNVGFSTIDRIFIATNVELEKMDDNPDKALQRYEFYEILVRVAQTKYKDQGICSTFAEAVEKLLRENIFPNAQPHDWQEFRDIELWTIDVNDILEANLEGIRKVYQHYWEPRKKYMSMQDALNLLMRDTNISFNEKDATYCYGMCKMTVVQENENSSQYKQLRFVELLELIGRLADFKFKHSEIDNQPLAKKVEYILDEILMLVEVERKDVNIEVDEQSESDDEY